MRTPLYEFEQWLYLCRRDNCLPLYVEVGPGLYRDILASEIMPELRHVYTVDESIKFFGVKVKPNSDLTEYDYRGVF